MIKKITIASMLTFISINVHAGKIIINESKTENVSSVLMGSDGIHVHIKEDSKKSYYIDLPTIAGLGLSKKEFTDILLSKNSSVALDYDKAHDHPVQPYIQTVSQVNQTAE